jgi:hypothetical protein
VKKITPIVIPMVRRKLKEARLTPQEMTQYLSVTQQLSWPARTTLPGLNYLVSELQQKASKATVADLARCNWVLKQAQKMSREGACLWFRKPAPGMEKVEPLVVAVHDASFAGQTDFGSQQGYLVAVGHRTSLEKPEKGHFHLVDWGSSKIHRVVRSTMAAEAASASMAHDRGTLVRYVLCQLGGTDQQLPWQVAMRDVAYAMVTDCRSLAEHCSKTGATVTEKRVALDIADVRAAVDAGDVLKWVPTDAMPADGLTKHLVAQPALDELTLRCKMRVCFGPEDSVKNRKLRGDFGPVGKPNNESRPEGAEVVDDLCLFVSCVSDVSLLTTAYPQHFAAKTLLCLARAQKCSKAQKCRVCAMAAPGETHVDLEEEALDFEGEMNVFPDHDVAEATEKKTLTFQIMMWQKPQKRRQLMRPRWSRTS